MAYRTRYELLSYEAEDQLPLDTKTAIAEWIRKNDEARLALLDDGSTNERASWYGWEQDLRELSASMPKVWFVLAGWGDEPGDIWRAYAKAGKLEKVQAELKFKVPGFFKLKH